MKIGLKCMQNLAVEQLFVKWNESFKEFFFFLFIMLVKCSKIMLTPFDQMIKQVQNQTLVKRIEKKNTKNIYRQNILFLFTCSVHEAETVDRNAIYNNSEQILAPRTLHSGAKINPNWKKNKTKPNRQMGPPTTGNRIAFWSRCKVALIYWTFERNRLKWFIKFKFRCSFKLVQIEIIKLCNKNTFYGIKDKYFRDNYN